jgi:hypothetical protein
VLEHFTIGLLSKQQQVKYEQAKMFDEVPKVDKKKNENMKEVP